MKTCWLGLSGSLWLLQRLHTQAGSCPRALMVKEKERKVFSIVEAKVEPVVTDALWYTVECKCRNAFEVSGNERVCVCLCMYCMCGHARIRYAGSTCRLSHSVSVFMALLSKFSSMAPTRRHLITEIAAEVARNRRKSNRPEWTCGTHKYAQALKYAYISSLPHASTCGVAHTFTRVWKTDPLFAQRWKSPSKALHHPTINQWGWGWTEVLTSRN